MPGIEVTKVDSGVLCIVPVASACELEKDTEGRALLVCEVNTLEVTWEVLIDVPYVSAPVAVTEEVMGKVAVMSVRRDSVGRPVAGFTVVFPVGVGARVGKRD